MRKVIILLIFISSSLISKSQNPNPYPERYVPTVNRTKYELPLWLYGGAYLSSITKKSNQMQVLVRDSVSQLIGYKYISAGGVDTINMTYSAPLRRNGNTISVPLTKNSNMNRVLVQDSVTGYFSYKYITAATTYSAGRGLTGTSTFTLDTAITGLTYTGNGLASRPLFKFNGSPYTGGTTTTTKPMILFEPSGTTGNLWSTNGTYFGINAPLTFAGNYFDIKAEGTTRLKLTYNGYLYLGGTYYTNGTNSYMGGYEVDAVGVVYWTGKSQISSPSDGIVKFTDNSQTTFDRLQLGGESSSYPSVKRAGNKIVSRLADNSANTNLQVKDTVFSTVWNGQIDVPTKNAVYDQMILKVNYTDTATMLSKYLRSADTLKLRQAVNLRVKYTDTSTMLSKYLRSADTLKLHNQVAARVKYTDTAAMLSPYVLESSVYAGTYTPVASDLTNVTSVSFTNNGTRYQRIGSVVHVTGSATVAVTTNNLTTSFELTLPISSTLGSGFNDIAGVASSSGDTPSGNVTNDNNHAQLSWGSNTIQAGTYIICYTYTYNIN